MILSMHFFFYLFDKILLIFILGFGLRIYRNTINKFSAFWLVRYSNLRGFWSFFWEASLLSSISLYFSSWPRRVNFGCHHNNAWEFWSSATRILSSVLWLYVPAIFFIWATALPPFSPPTFSSHQSLYYSEAPKYSAILDTPPILFYTSWLHSPTSHLRHPPLYIF